MNQISELTIKVFESESSNTADGFLKEITLKQIYDDWFIKSFSKEDVKGFVGGEVINGRRCNKNTLNRILLTLDIDGATKDIYDQIVDFLKN